MKRIYYYSKVLRRITSALELYFSDLHIFRQSKEGEDIQDILVPIVYGPMGKAYAYRKELESGKLYYQQRPKITFAISGMAYDEARTRSTNEMRLIYDPWFHKNHIDNALKQAFYADITPAAYNIQYKVEILCEYMDDFCQIAEQVLPWFNPAVQLRIKEWEFTNIERNIQILLSGMSTEFQEEYTTDDEIKVIKGTLNLEAKAWIYKPIRDGRLIEIINTQFHIDTIKEGEGDENFGLFGTFDHKKSPPPETILETKIRPEDDAKIYLTNRNLTSSVDIIDIDDSDTKNTHKHHKHERKFAAKKP